MDKKPAFALPLAAYGGDRRSPQAMQDQVDNINLKGGTQSAYLLRRLARDAPEVAALVGRKNIATFATASQ